MSYRDKESVPDANAWGSFRAKMARRGYSQAWIDKYINKREIMWGSHDHNVRSGYLGVDDVIESDEPELVSITRLALHLENQGWNVIDRVQRIKISSVAGEYILTQIYLQGCDFSGLNFPPLERDIRVGLNLQGFCS